MPSKQPRKSYSSREITVRTAYSGLLIATMLVLGYVESLVPAGVPGMKLGLSNSVLIFAVYMLGIPSAYILPEVLPSFGKLFPDVYFMVHQSDSAEIAAGVRSGLYDREGNEAP